jgi:transcriptional regulator with XRE-family HTH domain
MLILLCQLEETAFFYIEHSFPTMYNNSRKELLVMYGSLGAQIRHYRRMREMSQEELALAVGYKTKASINKIEKGKAVVPHDKLEEIARVLHVPIDNLIGGEGYVREKHIKDNSWEQRKSSTTESDMIEYALSSTNETAQKIRNHLMGALKELNVSVCADTTLVPKFNALSSSNQQVVMTLVDTLLRQQGTVLQIQKNTTTADSDGGDDSGTQKVAPSLQ